MPDFDFNRMQADAVRRAREMQSRARSPERRAQTRAAEPPAPPPEPEPEPQPAPLPAEESEPLAQQQPSLLDNLFQDRERTIILALLILLSGEDSNHELMFALMFLLM